MTQIVCPFCGARELHEFEFRKTIFTAADSEFARVYLRVDCWDSSVEHWQHLHGCRSWLQIERNPSTDAIRSVRLLSGDPR